MSAQITLDLDGDRCVFCDEPELVDLHEVWRDERAFMIETCCEGMHEAVIDELQGGSRAPWLRNLFASYGIDVRQVYDDGYGSLKLDWGLRLEDVDLDTAKQFVRRHHRHNAPPCGWRWGHAIYNGPDLCAVAMVGRPVARRLDHTTTVEVTRLCVDPNLDQALVWNACSMLYGAARKEAKRRGFTKVITYTHHSEPAVALRAVGWTQAALTRGGSWDRASRRRRGSAPTCRKIRWEVAA